MKALGAIYYRKEIIVQHSLCCREHEVYSTNCKEIGEESGEDRMG